MLAASAVVAAPPSYGISVLKTADPASVAPSGGSVTFTVHVTGTGTGFFQTVNVTDSLAGCTLGSKVVTAGDGDDKLEQGETWSYSCTVGGVTPGTQNTATVHACHNVSACNQSAHDATDSDSVTVTEGSATQPPATDPPVTDPPVTDPPVTDPPATDPPVTDPPVTDPPNSSDPDPTGDQAGATDPSTDTIDAGVGSARVPDKTVMLVIALGMLLASLILVTPAQPIRKRR